MQDYYMVRAGTDNYDGYWGTKTDPDGKQRIRDSEEEQYHFERDHRYITDFVNSLHVPRVLDFGAGLGWMLERITSSERTAIEIAPQAIERLTAKGFYVLQRIEQIGQANMDVVICHHVIEHLKDPCYVMAHFHRVLVKGGWLILSTPDFGSPCAQRFGKHFRLLHDQTHISLFTLASATRMLRDYGFTIQRCEFPFPDRYLTDDLLLRWKEYWKMSPPWPGNVFTLFCTRD